MKTMDGNEAAAYPAYKVTEISAIYPITPSSPMGELADQWSSEGKTNIWGTVPKVIEMQSEGGASGTLHGALQAGSLATTYTASQGLLLMIPNMYKIAGELTPCVIHVSARTLATHALSIFGDHSDVMAARSTGFAMLCSASVQEAHDMSMIAHAATLEARVPFLHFFEGFRTSHEVNKIELLSDDQIKAMIDDDLVLAHRRRSLSSDHPVVRGTAQNPDVFFQSSETSNTFYQLTPGIVEKTMKKFEEVTGRHYELVEYYGDPDADKVIVVMGSGAYTVRETIKKLNAKGEKLGVIQIHLYRPFPVDQFLSLLPKTTKTLAVLDRMKEPGALGAPLYQDVVTVLSEALADNRLPTQNMKVIAGRYGLSSKEFTPAMVKGIYDEMSKADPKHHFTIGIKDDVTFTSVNYDDAFNVASDDVTRAIFFGLGADGTVGANKNTIKIIGEETNNYAQGYFVYDSKKSGSRTVSHLRFGPNPIHAPYLVQSASFVGCHQFNFVEKVDMLKHAAEGAVFLLNSPYPADSVWEHLPLPVQKAIINKKLKFYVIDAYQVAKDSGMGMRINTIMQTCFFAISNVLPKDEAIAKIKEAIRKTYGKKGEEIVNKNFAAVDNSLANLHEVQVPDHTSEGAKELPPVVSDKAPAFVKNVTAMIMADRGDELPVSAFPIDGTYPCGTTKWEKRNVSLDVANWKAETCIQCGRCSFVCPHGVIRVKRYSDAELKNAPEAFKSAPLKGKDAAGKAFTLQVYLEDCTGCGLCHEACPVKDKENPAVRAINILPKEPVLEAERKNIEFFEKINTETDFDRSTVPGVQYLQPYFEFSGACAGCGETPYVKLISQLFGDRMLVANATGCSSIYGGNLPTTPWVCDENGRGPAWSNSLFEDNAEFGFGFQLSIDKSREHAFELLEAMADKVGENLVEAIRADLDKKDDASIKAQRERIAELKTKLETMKTDQAANLLSLADYLVAHSVWVMGGDGWAYDIGYGGLDHVLAQGKDINILVLDTEVYSNTGGQASKATPLAAVAKFAAAGKPVPKKDLARMAMTYDKIYVAQIAMGANPAQTLKAVREAEAFDGPSLILAYSHCITHGINMQKGLELQKMAVDCGYWPLFRYNTDRIKEGLNPFQLDSKKPTLTLKDYAYNEVRFKTLLKSHPELAEELIEKAQEEVDYRWKIYEKLGEEK